MPLHDRIFQRGFYKMQSIAMRRGTDSGKTAETSARFREENAPWNCRILIRGDCRPSVFLPPDAPGGGAAHMPRHMRRRRFRQGGSFPPRRDCGMSEYALPSDAAGGTRRLFPEAKPPEDQNPSDPRSGEMYASLPERDRCPGRKVGFPFSSVPGASYLFGEGCFRHFSHAACLPIRPPAPPGAGIVPAFPAFP